MKNSFRPSACYLAIAFVLEPSLVSVLNGEVRVSSHHKSILHGSRSARLDGLVSNGVAEDSMLVRGIRLRFKLGDEQQRELDKLLQDQQNPSSALYHAWLTPEAYGARFGAKPDDYFRIRKWIVSEGFQIDYDARSRTHISFSGTARQVRTSFGTDLHYYQVDNERHFANASDVEIPSEFEPLISTIRGLDDFPQQGAAKSINSANVDGALTPADLALIYNLNPLYQKGITGAGQKIVVVGQSGFNLQDVRKFREAMGLPANEPKIILIPGVRDPGPNEFLREALLNVEFAGGVAPDASVLYVYGPDVKRATEYAVDQNLAPVLSYSFVSCEKQNKPDWGWFRNVVQQAAVEGITWVAASGDTGPAGCESARTDSAATRGLAVNLPASVPEVTGVGGSEFRERCRHARSSTKCRNAISTESYIPEIAWNDTASGTLLSAGGGGASSAFPRPDWQTGPGVPNDNARHVPDIAFTASVDHDPYRIVIGGEFANAGGTSAGTPFFAGVLALLNQYVIDNRIQTQPGLGAINSRLYQLAQTTPEVFHDIGAGNNIIPCQPGTPDCTNGKYGFEAGPGYDHITGLGSVDAVRLFEAWQSAKPTHNPVTNVTISVEPSPVYKQAPDQDGFEWFYKVVVKETGGAPALIRSFSIDAEDVSDRIDDWFGTPNVPARGTLIAEGKSRASAVPAEHSFALSGFDSNGQPWSSRISVLFLGEKSDPVLSLTGEPAVSSGTGDRDPRCPADHPIYHVLTVKERNGLGVTLNQFHAEGLDYTSQIATWFGNTQLAPGGTLRAGLCWAVDQHQTAASYEVGGVDESGQPVRATLTVEFSGMEPGSGLAGGGIASALTTPPAVEVPVSPGIPLRSRPIHRNRWK